MIKLGTDPEFPIWDTLTRRHVPAHKVGLGPKTRPWRGHGWRGKAFRDGYMLEINAEPASCRQTLSFSVVDVLRGVQQRLGPRYRLDTRPAVKIDLKRDMLRAPVDVRQFGCEPSFCSYDLVTKVPAIDAITHPWRYAGGHVHFSIPNPYNHSWLWDASNYPDIGKLLDWKLGLPLSFLFGGSLQWQRRKYYGQAGEFRPQRYPDGSRGFEYRTPGPEVWSHPAVASWVLGLGRYTILHFRTLLREYPKKLADDIRTYINTGEGNFNKLFSPTPGYGLTTAMLRTMRLRLATPRRFACIDTVYDRVAPVILSGFTGWWLDR